MDSIYVVMPAYNEEENIRKTVKHGTLSWMEKRKHPG